jgi:hypothetical protein
VPTRPLLPFIRRLLLGLPQLLAGHLQGLEELGMPFG